MKLPRWLVIAMLGSSALSAIIAPGWWWVTWPQRTGRTFVGLVAEGRLSDANKMLAVPTSHPTTDVLVHAFDWFAWWERSKVEPQPRTLLDLLLGRQQFEAIQDSEYDYELVAERGAITVARTRMVAMFINQESLRELGLRTIVVKITWVGMDQNSD